MILIPNSPEYENDVRDLRPKEDIFAFAERQYSGGVDQKSQGFIEIETKQRTSIASISQFENEESKASTSLEN